MIDLRAIRTEPDRLRASLRARGEDDAVVDRLLGLDSRRRSAQAEFERLRAEQRSRGLDALDSLGDAKALSRQVKAARAEARSLEVELNELLCEVPNLVEEEVPAGGQEDFEILECVGEPRSFSFEPRDHLEIGEALGAIDMARAAKVAGARFAYLTGVGAMLQLALLNLAMEQAVEAGFTPISPPSFVRPEVMEGTGFARGALPADWLVGTPEVSLAAYHMDEIIEELPRRYVAWSTCYDNAAGSYGTETHGILRTRQFERVEMFSYCDPADAAKEHLRLLDWQKQLLAKAELPFRVIDVAAGDLGAVAARKYSCETWVPAGKAFRDSRGFRGFRGFREVTSASNFTSFQARRLGIRFRSLEGRLEHVATLSGSLASTRWIAAILETHQQEDGSVRVPEAMRKYLGLECLVPVRRTQAKARGT